MENDTSSTAHAEKRRLAAIMFTDIVGFSRQMGSNEARTLRLLDAHNQLIHKAVAEHRGTVIKTVGDAFLVDFPSVVHAVQSAQRIQEQFRTHNADKQPTEQIHVRIGIHLGDIIQKDGDLFGDGVNIAARLQALSEPDTICISDVVYRDVAKKLDLGAVVSLGRPQLKNIAERFPVYALLPETPKGFRQTLQVQRLKLNRWVRPAPQVMMAGLVLVTATFLAVRYFSLPTPSTQLLTPSTQSLPFPDKPSIVVLPFTNMSNDPSQDYFSDGITEDITTDLSKLSSLFVISRNSAFTYKGKAVKVQDVSREMGVRYVLEGSVRKADDQVRITTQLIDATTGGHLWSERYDRPLKDIFALQDEITQKIVTTLKLQLTLWERGYLARERTTDSLGAYDYYLRGVERFWYFTQEANTQARQMFTKAVELDPAYAEAYARLGWTYSAEWVFQWSFDFQTLEQALALAQKAIALDDALPRAHALLGFIYLYKKQHDQALTEGTRATTLDPNDAENYTVLAQILNYADRPEEAITLVERAMRLNPHSPAYYLLVLGHAYRLTGQEEKAIVALKSALARNANFLGAHMVLAIIYGELGREVEARVEGAEILRLNPHFSIEAWKQRFPHRDSAIVERSLAALRKAGLK